MVSDKLVVFADSEQYEQRIAMESIERPHYAYNNNNSRQSVHKKMQTNNAGKLKVRMLLFILIEVDYLSRKVMRTYTTDNGIHYHSDNDSNYKWFCTFKTSFSFVQSSIR